MSFEWICCELWLRATQRNSLQHTVSSSSLWKQNVYCLISLMQFSWQHRQRHQYKFKWSCLLLQQIQKYGSILLKVFNCSKNRGTGASQTDFHNSPFSVTVGFVVKADALSEIWHYFSCICHSQQSHVHQKPFSKRCFKLMQTKRANMSKSRQAECSQKQRSQMWYKI